MEPCATVGYPACHCVMFPLQPLSWFSDRCWWFGCPIAPALPVKPLRPAESALRMGDSGAKKPDGERAISPHPNWMGWERKGDMICHSFQFWLFWESSLWDCSSSKNTVIFFYSLATPKRYFPGWLWSQFPLLLLTLLTALQLVARSLGKSWSHF